MRGLRKYLTPFAPDQSGAVSVLFELGGIVVICDAGGCTGNQCCFHEQSLLSRIRFCYQYSINENDVHRLYI